jgi:L-rhamnose mutarotase
MQRLVYALDLHDDPVLIAEYEAWHRSDRVWPSIIDSLWDSGITNLEIFRTGNRLVLIIDASNHFSPDAKAAADASNPEVQAWEQLMWTFQKALPWAPPGAKWVLMDRIFSLAQISDAGG